MGFSGSAFNVAEPSTQLIETYLLIILIALILLVLINVANLVCSTRVAFANGWDCVPSDTDSDWLDHSLPSQSITALMQEDHNKLCAPAPAAHNTSSECNSPLAPARQGSTRLVDSVHDHRVRHRRLMRRKTDINKSLKKHNHKYMIMRPKAGCNPNGLGSESPKVRRAGWSRAKPMPVTLPHNTGAQHSPLAGTCADHAEAVQGSLLHSEDDTGGGGTGIDIDGRALITSQLATMHEEEETSEYCV